MPNQNFRNRPQSRGHADLFREQMSAYGEQADTQFESFKQAKNMIAMRLQQIQQRKETLATALEKRIRSISNKTSAQHYQGILDQLRGQFVAGEQEVVRQANAGISRIQEAHTRGRLLPQEVFAAALNAERQAVERLDGIVTTYFNRARSSEQQLRGYNVDLKNQTDAQQKSYDKLEQEIYGDVRVRDAEREVKTAQQALQTAKEDAAAGRLTQLKAERGTLEADRATKQGDLDTAKTTFVTATTQLETAKGELDAAKALPTEIEQAEQAVKAAEDAVEPVQRELDTKRADAAAGRVDAALLRKPNELAAINACNAKADADEAAVVAPRIPQKKKAIREKQEKDVALIREFYKAKMTLDSANKEVTEAKKRFNVAKKKVNDAAAALAVAPVGPGRLWQDVHKEVIQKRQEAVDTAQQVVTAADTEVKKLEGELATQFTKPIEELDAQIKPLEEPITQAQEAIRIATQKRNNLRGVVRTPTSGPQQEEFLNQSRSLLTQINKEGKYMREHFSGEAEVEQRTIDLVKRRTDIATEVAERSKSEADIRAALSYTREELRWLKKNADQHGERIAVLIQLERQWVREYAVALTKATNTILATGTPEQKIAAIERELQHLPSVEGLAAQARAKRLSNPVAGPARGKLQLVRDALYAPLRGKTTAALTDVPDNLNDDQLTKALAAVREEGRFLHRTNHVPVEGGTLDDGRLTYLVAKYNDINRVIAERGYNRLNQSTEAALAKTDARGLMEGMGVMQTELAQLRMANARPERQEELQAKITEQLKAVATRVDTDVRVALSSGDADKITQAMEGVRSEIAMHTEEGMAETERRAGELRSNYEALLTSLQNLSVSAHSDAMMPEATTRQMESAFVLLNREEQQLQNAPKVSMLVSTKLPNGSWTQQREMRLPVRLDNRLQTVRAMRSELMQRVTVEIDQLAVKKTSLDSKSVARAIALIDVEKRMDAMCPVVNEARAAERLTLRSELATKKSDVVERETVQQSRTEVQTSHALNTEILPQLENGIAEMDTDAKVAEMRRPKNNATRQGRIAWMEQIIGALERMQEQQVSDVLRQDIVTAQVLALRLLTRYQLPQENAAVIQKGVEQHSVVADAKIAHIKEAKTVDDLNRAIVEALGFTLTLDAWAKLIEAEKYNGKDAVDAVQKRVVDAIEEGRQILKLMGKPDTTPPPGPPRPPAPGGRTV
ncbi:hypothetical protein AUJ46_05955 [Candidatus Peregrinibacteria bacterium CG1_02_54_53]|nr:MAG: hypothetical protein AUJ46_05955 [Candidatus Peregrinibacteria bacterium CG1_02_54_53]